MMHKLYILLIAFIFSTFLFAQNKIKVKSTPNWVKIQNIDTNLSFNEDEISQGSMLLLADYQIHIPKQEYYFRSVTKITNKSGIQEASDINAAFDPLYQKLFFHSIVVYRDGKQINKLKVENFQVLRRELNAENYLYDGALTAVSNLSDIRNGDIVDISYTVKGFNPLHKGKFADTFVLNDYSPIGKINVSITAKNNLNYKLFNTDLKPKIGTNGGYSSYNWNIENPKPTVYEEGIPTSKILMPTVAVSQYNSIKEVVDWAYDLYDVNEEISKDLKNFIKEICSTYHTKGERVKALLDFVQNDIRYLGLEYGIGSYKPHTPNTVFKQRFGDCKDKSLLLVKMLREIEVEAYPVLLNTTLKHQVLNLPPSPVFFNHCAVKVVDDYYGDLYYDPTQVDQGGTFSNVHFPNYENVLAIYEGNSTFDTIMSASVNYSVTLEEFDILNLKGDATLKVTNTYADVEADRMRYYFRNNSKSSIEKSYLDFYSEYFPNIKSTRELSTSDNLSTNEFMVTEFYEIDSIWQPMKLKPGYISITFYPTNIINSLYIPNFRNRINEFSLPYPTSKDHQTKINLPMNWTVNNTDGSISNDMFYADFSVNYAASINQIQVNSYIKFQKSLVEKHEFKEFETDIKQLESQLGYKIFIPENANSLIGNNKSINYTSDLISFKIVIFIILIVILIVVLLRASNKRNVY